jgi:hypothetical protein
VRIEQNDAGFTFRPDSRQVIIREVHDPFGEKSKPLEDGTLIHLQRILPKDVRICFLFFCIGTGDVDERAASATYGGIIQDIDERTVEVRQEDDLIRGPNLRRPEKIPLRYVSGLKGQARYPMV